MNAREPAARDAAAVAAVLRGETVSYRELVERYQRLVYAVTWSRLGDATLAEDAAQEAFIRAYRSLPLLGNGAKFSAWVTTIARNTAISLGLKQRRELAKRERWALEQPVSEPPAATTEESCPPEMLRLALAELSAEHRESLVLFYLEGKRGAEAAAALGISEAALRMRLLRARAALRERLEARLGESLAQLQPPRSLTPEVMSVVLSSSTAKAGGGATLGTALLAALGKVLPFKIALSIAPLLVGWAFAANWAARRELQKQLRNLRDQEGFRAKIYQQNMSRRNLFWASAKMTVFLGILWWAYKMIEVRLIFGITSGVLLVLLVQRARRLPINRGKYMIHGLIGLLFPIGFGLVIAYYGERETGWGPLITAILLVGMTLHTIALQNAQPPPRLDNNLFLREQQGLLPGSVENAGVVGPLSSAQLFAFARFLGERYLVDDFRWRRRGEELMLKTTGPVKSSLWLALVNVFLPKFRWPHWSWICLKTDGTVSAHCSEYGAQKVREEPGQENYDIGTMERRVASAVAAAWGSFRAGNRVEAERAIGQVPEAEIFIALPAPALTKEGALKAVVVGIVIFIVALPLGMVVVTIIKALKH